jgi:hypothetical protein
MRFTFLYPAPLLVPLKGGTMRTELIDPVAILPVPWREAAQTEEEEYMRQSAIQQARRTIAAIETLRFHVRPSSGYARGWNDALEALLSKLMQEY